MAEYRLAPAAAGDLEDIWKYTARQWGIEQADRYVDVLIAAFHALSKTPRAAPACDHIRRGYRRQIVERHMIYFRVTDYGIAVVRILHDRMDAREHL